MPCCCQLPSTALHLISPLPLGLCSQGRRLPGGVCGCRQAAAAGVRRHRDVCGQPEHQLHQVRVGLVQHFASSAGCSNICVLSMCLPARLRLAPCSRALIFFLACPTAQTTASAPSPASSVLSGAACAGCVRYAACWAGVLGGYHAWRRSTARPQRPKRRHPHSSAPSALPHPAARARQQRRCVGRPTCWPWRRWPAARRRPGIGAPRKCACRWERWRGDGGAIVSDQAAVHRPSACGMHAAGIASPGENLRCLPARPCCRTGRHPPRLRR